MPSDLVQKSCAPCHIGTPPLRGAVLARFSSHLPAWHVVEEHHLRRDYKFPDFASALRFVNAIGEIAEREQHHPDIELGWGKVGVTTYTHSIGGLSENDFILAAKFDAAFQPGAQAA